MRRNERKMEAKTYTIVKDGSAWCCYTNGFVNLQESDNYAFGESPEEALTKMLILESEQ
jgi:hypothetical protein